MHTRTCQHCTEGNPGKVRFDAEKKKKNQLDLHPLLLKLWPPSYARYTPAPELRPATHARLAVVNGHILSPTLQRNQKETRKVRARSRTRLRLEQGKLLGPALALVATAHVIDWHGIASQVSGS